MATSPMLSARIFLFILANTFDLFNCAERSDWTYDRDTELVNITIANGTTYSCRVLQDVILPPKSQSANDTECTCVDDTDILDSKSDEKRSARIRPAVPTEEELFEEIEQVYRWLPLNPISYEWIIEVTGNITRMRIEYSENEGVSKSIELAWNLTKDMLHLQQIRLPELRKEVSRLQASFWEKKSKLALRIDNTGALGESETLDLRTLVVYKGTKTLSDDCSEDAPDNWKALTMAREVFMDMVLQRKLLEQQVVEARMKMLSAMAKTNGIVAFIRADLTTQVDDYLEQARQSTKSKNADMEE